MAKTKIRIAQVGILNHGLTILQAIRDSETLELVSVFDIEGEEARKATKGLSVRHADTYEAILKEKDVEAVALVTPNHLHAAQIAAAFSAGKHVFVEKPITRTVAEAHQSIAQARSAGKLLMVGHNTRRRPLFRRAKAILEEGRIGVIAGVDMNMSRPVGIRAGLPAWKTDANAANLIPMTQLGIHFADTIDYLLGPVARVACVANNAAMPGGAWDSSSSILQLESGVPVALSGSYVTPDEYFLRIYGTKGILHCHVSGLKMELLEGDALRTAMSEDFPNEGFASYREEMNEFGECILHSKQPETGGGEGLRALAVIEAMVQSISTRRVIDMKEILQS
ncbi:MAG: Gfo/Idh/MocA family oxidoreductase [Bacteroidota bacterium]